MAERTKLTKTAIASLSADPNRQLFVWDTELRGFGLRIAPAGTKTFIFQRRIGSRSKRVTIGRADDMAPEAARKKALALATQFADGVDPDAAAAQQAARMMTLRQAFDAYKAAPKKKGGGRGTPKKPQTVRDIDKAAKRFSDWLNFPVSTITGTMVKTRHAEWVERSPAQANQAFRYLRAALNHVIADADDDQDPILRRNPVDRLNRLNQWAEVRPRQRHLPEDRIADWVGAVETGLVGLRGDSEIRDALIFILLTGARLAEVLGNERDGYAPLAWKDVDLSKRLVTFRETKNREPHILPLPEQLTARLEARREISKQEHVFAGDRGRVPADMRGAYRRIEAATGMWITAHDLRRTFASVATRLDISAYKLKRLTNHISGGDVTAGYVQVTPEDLREAMQRIEDYMLSPGRRAEVFQLSQAR
ncbi:MAG: integrase family protein [Pseudomonadota bacterium]